MYNLTKFNPRKELKDFENEHFVFDESEQFSLNEKEEKIWSYLVTEESETHPLIFQLMWYNHQLCISYNTELPHEHLRQKASKMAHRIQAVLRQKVKANIVLEQPIITSFERYERNVSKSSLDAQIETLCAYLEKYTGDTQQRNSFLLYGEDGKLLGEALHEKEVATFTAKEEMIHELEIPVTMTNKQREGFLLMLQRFGYGVTYQEIEEYDKGTMLDFFSSGLIQFDK